MKKNYNLFIKTTTLVFMVAFCFMQNSNISAQDSSENWVMKKTYKSESITSSNSISTVATSLTYFDGLGRPIQKIAKGQGGTGEDLITHFEYDNLGRQIKQYLPYGRSSTSLSIDANPLGSATNFYNDPEYGETVIFFSETQFDNSPLNRVLKQSAPGDTWKMGNNHEVKYSYLTNDNNEVRQFSVTTSSSGMPTLAYVGYYPANQLYKTITYDENNITSTGNGSIEEFKDKMGRIVLKRHNTTITGSTKVPDASKRFDTYYFYDDFGNLSVVLPPKCSEQITGSGITNSKIDELGYKYSYDHRNRLVRKKLPGKHIEYVAYDNLNRPIATGPALSPFGNSATGWLHTKYDKFGRVAYTFWKQGNVSESDRTAIQNALSSTISETQTGTNTVNNVTFGYTNSVLPTSGFHVLTVNYYDNYDYYNASATIPSAVGVSNDIPVYYDKTNNIPKGLATGSWVRILTTSQSVEGKSSYSLYDEKSRPVRVRTDYPQSGFTQVDTKYNFTGNPVYTNTTHLLQSGGLLQTILEEFSYDDNQRLTKHTHKINNLPKELISNNEYDALGRLIEKKVGGVDLSASTYYQKVDYKYNVRGWLTNINNYNNLNDGTGVDFFAFKINYDEVDEDVNGSVVELYNGNIAETLWRTSSDNIKRSYGYSYDYTNRLLDAIYQKPSLATSIIQSYNEHITYDSNGNIQTLLRNGEYEGSDYTIGIDNLTYEYDSGNKLLNVTDSTNHTKGFNDVNQDTTGSNPDFSYDNYGNLKTDKNKGIVDIKYNHLNLPVTLDFGSSTGIDYIYDATGVKLKKIVNDLTNIDKITRYVDGFQYQSDVLDFFPHAEGYVKAVQLQFIGDPEYFYVYNHKDHLGNIRLSYGKDPYSNELVIIEENHYYPFGLTHNGYNNETKIYKKKEGVDEVELTTVNPYLGTTYKYGFNGKEEQNELNLNWHDFGARNYDAALGRWMSPDPLSEEFSSWSPYNGMMNNPIKYIDPTGMAAEDWIDNGDGTYTAEAGDSASTLAKDANISFEEANAIVQNQLGENYIDPADGVEKSNVEVGDRVDLNTEAEGPDADNVAMLNKMSKNFEINVPAKDLNGNYTSVSIDTDGDGLADSFLTPELPTEKSSDMGTTTFVTQTVFGQVAKSIFGAGASSIFSTQSTQAGENVMLENRRAGLDIVRGTKQQRDSVRLVRAGEKYHEGL